MPRRHKRNAPPPRMLAEPITAPPLRPTLSVSLAWVLPVDVSPRDAEHALDLAVMRELVTRWHWQGERLVAHTARVQATLALLAPTLGAPLSPEA